MKAVYLPRINSSVSRLFGDLPGLEDQLALLRESVTWSKKEIDNYTLRQINQLVQKACENHDLYKDLYKGLLPHSGFFSCLDEFFLFFFDLIILYEI